ncbi:MAG: diguanylate cyclase [Vallitaleaceae bacterium]|jgi:diguanylate cyclase (GGDEF)-like protein|nr:diguanylate cyclase [Vallitaleaceae bacterium]
MSFITSIINYLFYDKNLDQVLSETVILRFKNIIYSLLVESASVENRDEFYNLILAKAIEAIPNAHKGSILHKEKSSLMVFKAAYEHDINVLKSVEIYIEDTFLYIRTDGKLDKTTIIDNFKTVNERNLEKSKQETLDNMIIEMNTIISTPIWVDGNLWGMINIDSYNKNAFDQDAIDSLEIFAIEAAKAIKLYDALEKNNYLLRYDVLTGIHNRAYFNEILEDLFHDTQNKNSGVLVSIDLDKFKRINDLYGHLEGDKYLVYFSKVIKEHLKDTDVFSRYGGDEFIILSAKSNLNEMAILLEDIVQYFHETPYIINGSEEIIEFSYGIAVYMKEGMTSKSLLKLADQRMYAQKNRKSK